MVVLLEKKTRKNYQFITSRPGVPKGLLLVLLLAGSIFLLLFVSTTREPPKSASRSSHAAVFPENLPRLEPGPFQTLADRRRGLDKVAERLESGETLGHVLERLGLDRVEAGRVAEAVGQIIDLTRVRPGVEIALFREKETGEPARLEFNQGRDQHLILLKTSNGYVAGSLEYEPLVCWAAAQGRIKNSLWASAVVQHGLNPELVMTFADIFAYDIDFFTDIREGDEFRLLFEEKYCQGAGLGPGRILSAEFVNNGKQFKAYYYEASNGAGGYYDAEGRSLKKMFLKSPLRYRRISSFFSRSRFHPILKIYRPHLGVDYAAPTGTPVEALGDGRIAFIGWKGGYGHYMEIKHNRTYTTCYGHLSRFAKGLKNGQRVQQGDLIGYVGATGLATGPHLDFRVKKDGKPIDPLAMKMEPAPPIDPSQRGKFMALVKDLEAHMAGRLAARP